MFAMLHSHSTEFHLSELIVQVAVTDLAFQRCLTSEGNRSWCSGSTRARETGKRMHRAARQLMIPSKDQLSVIYRSSDNIRCISMRECES